MHPSRPEEHPTSDPPRQSIRADSVPHDPIANERARALTNFVANALGSRGACVLIARGDAPIACGIAHGPTFDFPTELAAIAFANETFVLETTSTLGALLARRGIGFFASATFALDAETRGALCAYDPEPIAFGTPQTYVLRTIADELAGVFAPTFGANPVAGFRLRVLESIAINALDAVLVTDARPLDSPGPRIVYANETFTRSTGYATPDILGKSPRILQGPGSDRRTIARIGERLRAYEHVEEELLNYRKDGTPFWVQLSITPVADDFGAITHFVAVQRDTTDRQNARAALERERASLIATEGLRYRATHDDLTALFNRGAFFDRLREERARVSSDATLRAAVLFLDLDGFKRINDTLGHRVGDLLLIEVAERLASCVRPGDMLARLGGDEFTYLLCEIGPDRDALATASGLARRVIEALRAPVYVDGNPILARASIGIAVFDPATDEPDDVIHRADIAMYRVKADGGNGYANFEPAMEAAYPRRAI